LHFPQFLGEATDHGTQAPDGEKSQCVAWTTESLEERTDYMASCVSTRDRLEAEDEKDEDIMRLY
jgi:hypothetical protein